jgi:hypothetical protein
MFPTWFLLRGAQGSEILCLDLSKFHKLTGWDVRGTLDGISRLIAGCGIGQKGDISDGEREVA